MSELIGRWLGSAEVYSGEGRFLGNGLDTRHVQAVGEGRVRIDVAFIGPLKASGHYFIQDMGDHRIYQGPINVGYAETLADGVVDSHAYWATLGLSQQFFLLVDSDRQLSLALMSRGSQLIYAIVGENQRVLDDTALPSIVNGTSYDLSDDPHAGRDCLFLHRAGSWAGDLKMLDGGRQPIGSARYCEAIDLTLTVHIEGGGFVTTAREYSLKTNQWQAWTPIGNTVGSYSLYGGRALSGDFHHLESQLRVARREVVSADGTMKAVVHHWYRGSERIGTQFGVLNFTGQS